MAERHVLSVPVIGADGKCTSFFDMQDFLACLLDGKDIEHMSVDEARNRSLMDVFWPVTKDLGLFSLAEIFSRGVHRVPVLDDAGTVVAVVSQSSLIQYVAQRIESDLKEKKDSNQNEKKNDDDDINVDQSLQSLHLISTKPLLSFPPDHTLRQACTAMRQRGVSGVGVVDPTHHNRILGCVSLASLRGRSVASLRKSLDAPLSEFLASTTTSTSGKDSPTPDFPESSKSIAGHAQMTLREALLAVSEVRAHQMWIVQRDSGSLEGVVSLGDLVRVCMKLAGHVSHHHHHQKK